MALLDPGSRSPVGGVEGMGKVMAKKETFIAPDEVVDAVEALLDAATKRHAGKDETFIECLMCGKWEEHDNACPIPSLRKWMGD
jgi:hypothetical protein